MLYRTGVYLNDYGYSVMRIFTDINADKDLDGS